MYDAEYVCEKLRLISKLSALAGENKFRSGSYIRAAESIEANLDSPIEDTNLQSFSGIGDKLAKKIDQIIQTGTCDKLEDLLQSHGGLLPLLEIPGVGPAKARDLYFNHECRDLEDIKELVRLKIITDKRIVEGVETGPEERIPHEQAHSLYIELANKIDGDDIRHIQAVGSLRRIADTVGDLDIVVLPWKKAAVATRIREALDTVSDDGDSKIGGSYKGIHVDFRFCKYEDMGAMLLYFTGPKEHCIALRKEAIKRGWTLNEYELYETSTGKHIAGGTEEEIYKALDMDFISPKDRK